MEWADSKDRIIILITAEEVFVMMLHRNKK